MKHASASFGLVLALVLAPGGCGAGASAEDRQPRPHPYRLTAEELEARSHSTAFDAVQALRPRWLQERGRPSIANPEAGEVVVYVDGARVGGPDFLRQIRVNDIAGMQYMSASEATTRFGTGHAGGAILVSTRRG